MMKAQQSQYKKRKINIRAQVGATDLQKRFVVFVVVDGGGGGGFLRGLK